MIVDSHARGSILVQLTRKAVSPADLEATTLQAESVGRSVGAWIKSLYENNRALRIFLLHVCGAVAVALVQGGNVENWFALNVLVNPCAGPPEQAVAWPLAVLLHKVQNRDRELKLLYLAWGQGVLGGGSNGLPSRQKLTFFKHQVASLKRKCAAFS